MVNNEILEDTKLNSLLPGTAQKRRARETVLYSSALVTNERVGRRLPELQMKEEELRHQKAVSTMTIFRADWVPDTVTWRSCNQTRLTAGLRGGRSEDNQLGFLSSLSLELG